MTDIKFTLSSQLSADGKDPASQIVEEEERKMGEYFTERGALICEHGRQKSICGECFPMPALAAPEEPVKKLGLMLADAFFLEFNPKDREPCKREARYLLSRSDELRAILASVKGEK